MYRLLLFLGIFFSLPLHQMAQNINVPLGGWRVHMTHRKAVDVEEVQDKIFVGTTSGFWTFNKSTGEREIFSKASGLSGVSVSQLGYSPASNALLIVYDDANMDILKDGEIINMPQIKNSGITGSRVLNNISMYGDTAILAFDFGIVLIDVNNEVVKASVQFSFSPEFAPLRCMDGEIFGNSYYFATTERVYQVNLNTNLLSLDNWDSVTTLHGGAYNHLAVFNNQLLASKSEFLASGGIITGMDTIFTLDLNNQLGTYYINPYKTLQGATVWNGNMTLVFSDEAHTVASTGNTIVTAGSNIISDGKCGLHASDGNTYFGDFTYGLSRAGLSNEMLYYPDGPTYNSSYGSSIAPDGTIWLASGSKDNDWKNEFIKDGVFYRKENDWKLAAIPDFGFSFPHQDFTTVLIDPSDTKHVFAGSWGTGLYEFYDYVCTAQIVNPVFDASNVGFPYRIGGMTFDEDGNLWVTNANTTNPLKKRSPQGVWTTVPISGIPNLSSYSCGDIIYDINGRIWFGVFGLGIVVYDPETSNRRLLNSSFNNGDLPNLLIRAIAQDNDGDIWIGTDDGIRVGSPSQVLNNTAYNFQKIVLTASDGINELLLNETAITDIAVDGANRKWISTNGSGVRLVSEDGRTIIQSFTEDNSPLLSNYVNGISIDHTTGEVYFSTRKGYCSYKSDATASESGFGDVLVYPNPVKPTYDGPISITGMAEDTDIKITDISGNLVYELKSLGGQAIWDGTRYDGKRVQTGVYLIFCANKDASETLITKILFIN